MSATKDPTVQRRRLQVELRRARTAAGLTQRAVASNLDWSPSKVLRIENGSVGISAVDLRALLAQYGEKDRHKIEELVQLARESKKQPFSEYNDVLQPPFLTYLAFEASASIIRQFEPQLVPGLLQTEEYAEAVQVALNPGTDPRILRRRVEARLERQELLERSPTERGEFFFIVDEAVIRRAVGGVGPMIRQLERIREIGSRPNITIQIVPFGAGAHYGMGGPFVVLEFDDPTTDNLLFVENERGDLVNRDDVEEIQKRLESFWDLEEIASEIGSLDAMLDDAIKQLNIGLNRLATPAVEEAATT
jgi:transcriptional regulator with XRE-family HTH domain